MLTFFAERKLKVIPNKLIDECLKARQETEAGSPATTGMVGEKKSDRIFNKVTRSEQKIIALIGFTPVSKEWLLVVSEKPLKTGNLKNPEWHKILQNMSEDWDYLRKQEYPNFLATSDPRVGFVFHPPGKRGWDMLKMAASHLTE